MTTAGRASRGDPNDRSALPGRHPTGRRAANIRTALALLAIALAFFFGVIASRFMGGYQVGMSVVGFAVFVFLVVAIGRNLRKGQ